ncbi:MAG: FtsX-like permease family protein [Nitrospinae bacterium]|nr:FtsX-like permease family protein [Nitrospinota bacterium]MZH05401.1 FtsX-like permease family protein [Nitrospinota bacterium]MZH13321.1 FtsX-like permease family protein [Nitrospinota bacterium]
MKFLTSFSIATRALLSHKTRTFLASLGILIGIASVIVMVATGKGSQQEVMDVIAGMGENMITINAGEMKRRGGRLRLSGNVITLTPRDAKRIADEIDEVELVAPFEERRMNAKFDNNTSETSIAGSTLDFPLIRGYKIEDGEMFTEKDLKTASRVAVIGKTTVKNLFGDEDPVGQVVKVHFIPFKIIGVFETKGVDTNGLDQDDLILIPLPTLMRRIVNQTHVSRIFVKISSRENILPGTEKIRELLRESHKLKDEKEDDFTMVSQLDLEEMKRETSELFTKLIVGVAAISLLVGGIGILAVMLISVKERTREIGIRRAVGATRRDIIRQFLYESLIIGIIGGGLGIALGVGLTLGLTHWGDWTLLLDKNSIWTASWVCALIGIVFGVFPAIKASKLDPMEALTIE